MRISELKLGKYVVVNDLGASKYSSGMRVIGRVIKIDDNYNYAIIESLPNHRYEITDFNDFEYWSKSIEDKTESVNEKESGITVDKKYFDDIDEAPFYNKARAEAMNKVIEETRRYTNKTLSNDLQQRKRNDTVNHPSHYNYGDIEVIDFIEQVTQHYNPNVAYHIGNAIKYLARSPHKNGKEDVEKARWYIERAFENWDVK